MITENDRDVCKPIAETILSQISGVTKIELGLKTPVYGRGYLLGIHHDKNASYLSLGYGRGNNKRILIALNGNDLYDIYFTRLTKALDLRVSEIFRDVFAEDLNKVLLEGMQHAN